jgi:transcriptional regulator with XRE-family HTH domain
MDVGKKIQMIRVAKETKQSDVALAIGVDVSSYSRIERKGNKITIEQLQAIANALGVSLSELLELDVPVESENKIKELEKEIEKVKGKNTELDHAVGSLNAYLNSTLKHYVIKIAIENHYKTSYSLSIQREVNTDWEFIGLYNSRKEVDEEFSRLDDTGEFTGFSCEQEINDIDRRKVYEIMANSKEYKKVFLVLLGTNMIADKLAMSFYVRLLHGDNNS